MIAKCVMCDKNDTSLRCSKCKVATYCTPICQKRHWKYQHKVDCRPCLTDPLLLGHIFDGRSKDDILEYGSKQGAEHFHDRGYPSLLGVALALQVSSSDLMEGLVSAHGQVLERWSRYWTPAERSVVLTDDPVCTAVSSLCGRLSPGFTAAMVILGGIDQDNELQKVPLRFYSTLDEFGRLKLMYAYSDHEGVDALSFCAKHYFNEDSAGLLTLTKTCVEHNIFFGGATESMHDSLDRSAFSSTQVALTPGYEEVVAAAVAAQLIAPANAKTRSGIEVFELCDISSWIVLA